jgi:A/G-specific adenine glycosylase
MLQQTQVSRVLEKYPRFLKRFPSFSALAKATPAEVIVAWRGMGYNNRAVRLRSLGQIVRDEHRGRLPADPQRLILLPGIGRYTANAVACFAFEQRVPLVDTNIARVLARVFPHAANEPWDIAAEILPGKRVYEWNQALMELGALVCTAANPKCGKCPLTGICPGAYKQRPRTYPVRKAEPGRKGVPNRIYRGRIVEELRRHDGGPASLSRLGIRIMPGFENRDRAWLLRLLKALEKDGVVRSVKRGDGHSVTLAS